MKGISAQEYHKHRDDVRTIDVRTPEENRMLARIDWAENIPIDTLLSNIAYYCPDKTETIVTVCNAGNRSGTAADALNREGYDAYVLVGGIYGYKRQFK